VLLADRVALMEDGRIAAVGTHHQLLRDSAAYRSLMSGQDAGNDSQGGSGQDGSGEDAQRGQQRRGQEGRPMTTAEDARENAKERPAGELPAEELPAEEGRPAAADDAFDHDVLPAPKGASLTLLRSLLAPRRARVWLAAVLLLLQQAAVQAGPLLVAFAIDRAVPALRDGDHGPLTAVGAGYLGCALASGPSSSRSSAPPPASARTCCWTCGAASTAMPRSSAWTSTSATPRGG
jgi:hypothetical protein